MKKILNWFKKRTVNKILIAVFSSETIWMLSIGQFDVAIITLGFLLSWFIIDAKESTIECQDRTIHQLFGDIEYLKDVARQDVCKDIVYNKNIQIKHAEKVYWFNKYLLEFTKVQFCKRMMSCSEYIKRLNNLEEEVRHSKEILDETKRRYACG